MKTTIAVTGHFRRRGKETSEFLGPQRRVDCLQENILPLARSTGIPDREIGGQLSSYSQPAELFKVEALRLTDTEFADI